MDQALRRQYETLRSVLYRNGTALQWMADLQADANHLGPSETALLRPVQRLLDETLLMAEELNLLSDQRHRALYETIEKIRGQVRAALREAPQGRERPLCLLLQEDGSCEPRVAGGKAAGLSILRQSLPDMVPDGFVVTTEAYRLFLRENGLMDRIRMLFNDLDVVAMHPRFEERTGAIRDLILQAPVPEAIRKALADHALALDPSGTKRWAVRSSALNEDDQRSFAGQFDTMLDVPAASLIDAYRSVLASRFSDRAVMYRMHCGLREADTPMAVLCMPMIDPVAAGVAYTCDPRDPQSGRMMIAAVPGLAERLVRGEEAGEIRYLPRSPENGETAPTGNRASTSPVLSEETADRIGRVAEEASRALGRELDIEWALDGSDRLWLLQARPLQMPAPEEIRASRRRDEAPLLERGYTLFPGRAEGPVEWRRARDESPLRLKAPVLVVDRGVPEFAPHLPRIAALLVEHGSPVGHLATLAREFRVPSIYGLEEGARLLRPHDVVSVDATSRRVHRRSIWPGVRERCLARVADAGERSLSGPLHDLVLALNLTDPYSSSFKATNCRSLHDVIRFVHEMSVRSLFRFGDRQNRFLRKSVKRLDSELPIRMRMVDLDGSTPAGSRKVEPRDVNSVPFQALWRGISDPRVSWRPRPLRHLDLDILPRGFVEEVFGGAAGPRRPGDANFVVVAADYLNLNARFVFHYAMLDAIVGPGKENNHVHFRFRGGGASEARRTRRTRFLETVLRHFHFGVDRRGDLVTAWLRGFPREESESALEMLGRLMACSRQLDLSAAGGDMMDTLVNRFLREEYSAFA